MRRKSKRKRYCLVRLLQAWGLRQLNMHQLRPGDIRIAFGFLLALLGEHVSGEDARSGERLFAVERRRAAHVAFHVRQAGTARARTEMRTGRADGKIAAAYRAHIIHLLRVPPDVQKLLLAHVSGRQRELHAGKDISIGRNVTERMAGAARQPI